MEIGTQQEVMPCAVGLLEYGGKKGCTVPFGKKECLFKATMKLTEMFLNVLFPPKCPFCNHVVDDIGICPDCEKKIPWLKEGESIWHGPENLRCAGALSYEGAVREGLLRFKFHGASAAGDVLGQLVAQCAAEQFAGEFDVVTWVPVSRKRLRERGYDQAEILARAACRIWETEPVQLLKKAVNTPAQSGLHDAAARRANVLGVYEPVTENVVGKKILLLDDIVTTGATLGEGVRVLREAGAADVMCLTLARSREKKA